MYAIVAEDEEEAAALGCVANLLVSSYFEPPRVYRRVDCLSQAALSDSVRLS